MNPPKVKDHIFKQPIYSDKNDDGVITSDTVLQAFYKNIHLVRKSSYIRNIFVVMSGTSAAQLVTVLIAPILTRIYNPGYFGEFAFFLAVVNITVVISTLKYEQAIFLPPEEDKAFNILALSLVFVIGTSLLILLSIILLQFFTPISKSFMNEHSWIYLVPLLVFAQGTYYCFRNWVSREGFYKVISYGMIFKTIVTNAAFLVLGYFKFLSSGLIIGAILGQFAESILLLAIIIKKSHTLFPTIDYREIIKLFKRYKDFPKYSLPAEVINNFGAQNPVFVLASFYTPAIVGNYSLIQRVLGLPVKIISGSTLEVFKKKASNEKNTKGNFSSVYLKTFLMLLIIGIIPAILFWFLLPDLVPLIFGKEWAEAGLYARYLAIMFLFQFTISPLGFSLYLAEKQKYNLYWQILLLVFTSIGLFTGVLLKQAALSILFFSVSYSLMYILYFYWGLKFSK